MITISIQWIGIIQIARISTSREKFAVYHETKYQNVDETTYISDMLVV